MTTLIYFILYGCASVKTNVQYICTLQYIFYLSCLHDIYVIFIYYYHNININTIFSDRMNDFKLISESNNNDVETKICDQKNTELFHGFGDEIIPGRIKLVTEGEGDEENVVNVLEKKGEGSEDLLWQK